jgi:hypothetical protein
VRNNARILMTVAVGGSALVAITYLIAGLAAAVGMAVGVIGGCVFVMMSFMGVTLFVDRVRYSFGLKLAKYFFPVATLFVDGQIIRIPYHRIIDRRARGSARHLAYHSVVDYVKENGYLWNITLVMLKLGPDAPVANFKYAAEHRATLQFQGVDIPVQMRVIPDRCPCKRIPPCWTGSGYAGVTFLDHANHTWMVTIKVILVGGGPGDLSKARKFTGRVHSNPKLNPLANSI